MLYMACKVVIIRYKSHKFFYGGRPSRKLKKRIDILGRERDSLILNRWQVLNERPPSIHHGEDDIERQFVQIAGRLESSL